MSVQKYLDSQPIGLEAHPLREIARYSSGDYAKIAVKYTGTPRKHPYDPDKVLLVSGPLAGATFLYEFRLEDVVHAEDASNFVTESGDSLPTVDIWVRKGSVGLLMKPFEVGAADHAERKKIE